MKKVGNRFGVGIILGAIWDRFGGCRDLMRLRNSSETSEHIKLCKSTQIYLLNARERSWKREKRGVKCFS